MTVTGLLLAAGAGHRFGRPKALVEFAGEPLVTRGVRLLLEGGCDRVLVVLGAEVEGARGAVGTAQVVVAPDWATGIGASLRAGLAALEEDVQACVVALADQVLVRPAAVARLLSAWRAGARVAVAAYGGKQRNPVLLDRTIWDEVAELAVGDAGARAWLRAHPEQVLAVECGDTGDPFDIDTCADLDTLNEDPALRAGRTVPAGNTGP